MGVIWILIPLSVLLVLAALRAFSWAIKNRQFDDLDREAARILFEEPEPREVDRTDRRDLPGE